MKNEELIKALRCCADYSTGCYECPFDGKCIHESIAYNMDLKLAAADALEVAEQRIAGLETQLPSAQQERTEYIPETKAVRSKRDCVDLSERVSATFYDQEHEEWTQQIVTIADVLDSVCDEYTILPSAQPEPRWIPVTERLPKIGEKVLVSTKCTVFTQVFKRIYGTPDRWGWEHNTIKKVTAWMPLPEPYREEKNDE